MVEHWRLRGGTARIRPVVDALVADGRLERVAVDDGGARCSSPAGAELDPRHRGGSALSPFDNLLWDRPFAERVLGFHHLIEVYKPAHERRYGYYVLPFLWRDRIVGRADLKSERSRGDARRQAFHREDGVRRRRRSTTRSTGRSTGSAARAALERDRCRRAGSDGHAIYDRRRWTSRPAPSTPARSPIRHRRGDDADLPDLDVRAGGGRREQGLRLRARRQPDAHGARGVPRVARGAEYGHRVLVRPRRGDDDHAPRRPGRARRLRERRLRRHVPHVLAGLRAEGLRLHYVTPEEVSTDLADHLDERTRIVWVETPTNPLLNIVDIRAAADAAHAAGALLVVDNTFATPYLQQPLELGADIVVHSTTKYLGGHSDVVGGFAATNDPTIAERLRFLQKSLGAVPGPFDAWLVLRGLKTLAVRMRQHCENARAVVAFLQDHPAVTEVLYPGLPDHPGHEIAARQMRDFGGMVSFLVESEDEAVDLVARTQIWTLAESLGGVESLIEHPARMTHASTATRPVRLPAQPRAAVGRDRVRRRPRRRSRAGAGTRSALAPPVIRERRTTRFV